VSKEGQRIYVKNKDIRTVKNNFGISIISTPKGIMTGFEARKQGLGGEIVCEVW
jgi:small subunit ribosomal protein S8